MSATRCAWLVVLGMLSAGVPTRAAVNALVLGGEVDAAYTKHLEAKGFKLVCRAWKAPAVRPDQLKRFNVVVLGAIPDTYGGGLYDPSGLKLLEARKTLAAIDGYIRAGGGALFVSQTSGGGQAAAESMSRALAPWGVKVLGEQVRDPKHQFNNYSWTQAVTPHPATRGVRRVYYPVNLMRWDDAYATNPIVPTGKGWTVLVRGESTSVAARNIQGSYSDEGWEPATGGRTPVLVAVRTLGKGRLGAMGIGAQFVLWNVSNKKDWIGENRTGPIDWIPQKRGDGKTPSDLGKLVEQLLGWLAEPGRTLGSGGALPTFDQDKPVKPGERPAWTKVDWDTAELPPTWAHTPMIHRYDGQYYYPEVRDVLVEGPVRYYKALIGAHTAYSDGTGTVAQFAAAARRAGYACLVFTEAFEHLTRQEWARLRDDCRRVSDKTFVALAGIDIADPYANRFILFGQTAYPPAQALQKKVPGTFSAKGPQNAPQKRFLEPFSAIVRTQFFSLGFSDHMVAVHRPSSTPLVHELHKHFFGWVVYTYRGGKLIDNGFPGYEWQVNASSNPCPIVVHEILDPAKLAEEAAVGFQQIMPGSSVTQAVHYFRHGLPHYFACPPRYLLSEGPIIDTWTVINKDEGRAADRRDHWRVGVGATAEEPIVEATLFDRYAVSRRWRPNAKTFRATVDGWHGSQHFLILVVRDQKGRRAISSSIRTVPHHYFVRCADRQNWFGSDSSYTGTIVPGFNIMVPAFGTREGQGFWGSMHGPVRGENMAPIKGFPYASDAVSVNEYQLDQRYTRAIWLDVVFDAKPSNDTARSRVYAGLVRRWVFHGAPTLEQVDLRLRRPVNVTEPVFPVLCAVNLGKSPVMLPNGEQADWKGKTFIDLPEGARIGSILVLHKGLRIDRRGRLGFPAQPYAGGAQPAGTAWQANLLRVDPKKKQTLPPWHVVRQTKATPYAFKTIRGQPQRLHYIAYFKAQHGGVAAVVKPAKIGYDLPLGITGVNPNWDAAVWRPGKGLVHFGVFEGRGWARLDVSAAGTFYAGNIICCDQARLRLAVVRWDKQGIRFEAHNPTDAQVQTTVETPAEITDYYRLNAKVVVAPGTTRHFVFPEDQP